MKSIISLLLIFLSIASFAQEESKTGKISGIGGDILSTGRFGLAKGDGLLDVEYPHFGIIEKQYFLKHPANKNGIDWAVSFFPPEVNRRPLFNNLNPERSKWSRTPPLTKDKDFQDYGPDKISINWICTQWQTDFISTGNLPGRQKGDRVSYDKA